jgi:hypothetical protein
MADAAPVVTAPETKPVEKDWKAEAERKEEVIRATQARNKLQEEELTQYRQSEAERKAKETQTQEEQERAKLTEQGKYMEAVKLVETKHQSEVQNLYSTINTTFVPAAIKSAGAKVKNITPEALEDLPSLLTNRIKLHPKTFQPFVVDEKGEQLKDEKLNPISVESFVESFVKSRTYMLVDGMPKGTGATATSGGKALTIEAAMADPKLGAEWKKSDPQGYQAAFSAYVKGAKNRAREQAKAQAGSVVHFNP